VLSSGLRPESLAAADFNGDGLADLAAAGDAGADVLLGRGDGSFEQSSAPADAGATAVVAADLNGDAQADFAVANPNVIICLFIIDPCVSPPSTVTVFLGDGDGSFQDPAVYEVGIYAASLAAADFNADGVTDLVTANLELENVSLLLGAGDGSFRPAVSFRDGEQAFFVVTGDFNGDGFTDLALANVYHDTVTVLLNDGVWGVAPDLPYTWRIDFVAADLLSLLRPARELAATPEDDYPSWDEGRIVTSQYSL
jgi:hypothetical protein